MSRILLIVIVAGCLGAVAAPADAGPYKDAVLDDGAFAYWRLGETTATAADSATATNPVTSTTNPTIDGTYIGLTDAEKNEPGLIFDDPDTAARFSGDNDQITVPVHPAIDSGGPYNKRTIELWFNADAVDTRQVLFEEGGAGVGLNLYLDGGELHFGGWDVNDPAFEHFLSAPIQAEKTYHAVLVFDSTAQAPGEPAGQVRAYLNGQPVGVGHGAGLLSSHSGGKTAIARVDTATNFHDGTFSGNGFAFSGVLDEIALYNLALTDPQIDDHYRQGIGIPEPAAVVVMLIATATLLGRRGR